MPYLYPRVICEDAFSMSVQAHRGAYCIPREDGADSYSMVEIGFPSAIEPLLMEYADDPSEPCETVYGYVPADVVRVVVAKHGGLVSGELPPLA